MNKYRRLKMQVGGKGSHVPGCFESFSMIFRRIYHSYGYGLLYGFVMVLNLCLIIWLVVDKGDPKPIHIFVLLEAIVTVALVLEVIYTLKTQGLRLWLTDLSNWFDFLVAVVCTLSLVAYAIGEDLQGEVAVGVSSVRYGAQALRLGVLLRHARRKNTQGIAEFEQVRFDINFDAPSESSSSREAHSPTLSNYWGRGSAFSASPIFQNPSAKRFSAVHLDHTIKVLEPKSPTLTSPSLSRASSANSDSSVFIQDETDPLI